MDNIKEENVIPNEDRFSISNIIKIKRLKIGMILAIIAGSLFVTSQSLLIVNQNWYEAARQRLYIQYDAGVIDREEYYDRRDQLQLELYVNMWTISIFSTAAKIILYITFIFIISCLLSIVIDQSFNRKMRRLALGLAGITLLFILYPIFVGNNQFIFYPYY